MSASRHCTQFTLFLSLLSREHVEIMSLECVHSAKQAYMKEANGNKYQALDRKFGV